ncbi:MAG: hypothetical protein AABW99_04965, partial [archaeon]
MAKKEVLVFIIVFSLAVFTNFVLALEGVCVPVNPNTGAFECNTCEGSEISPAWIDRYNRECEQRRISGGGNQQTTSTVDPDTVLVDPD